MDPLDILQSHKDLFEFVEKTQTTPDASDNRIQAIWGAFKQINPSYNVDWCCGICVFNMIKSADRVRKEHELKFYTFPKQ